MKPSWDDAPLDARYLAQEANGGWCWFERKPVMFIAEFWNVWDIADHDDQWWFADSFDSQPNPNWKETLESRP